jgi:hypothetical protein
VGLISGDKTVTPRRFVKMKGKKEPRSGEKSKRGIRQEYPARWEAFWVGILPSIDPSLIIAMVVTLDYNYFLTMEVSNVRRHR